MIKLAFVDDHADVVAALAHAFRAHVEVAIVEGNMLALATNTIVSPANALGYMDGGIDRIYAQYFGERLERRVQDAIASRPEGFLPIGASLIVPTDDERIPYMIIAPTMLLPERVEATYAYRALRAALRVARQHEDIITHVFCPGLCTGVGDVSPDQAAAEMASAYADWKAQG